MRKEETNCEKGNRGSRELEVILAAMVRAYQVRVARASRLFV